MDPYERAAAVPIEGSSDVAVERTDGAAGTVRARFATEPECGFEVSYDVDPADGRLLRVRLAVRRQLRARLPRCDALDASLRPRRRRRRRRRDAARGAEAGLRAVGAGRGAGRPAGRRPVRRGAAAAAC